MQVHYFFKIFNNIKSSHETKYFAKMELEALFGDMEPVSNVVEICIKKPFSFFIENKIRVQDMLTLELPYGKIHGYTIKRNNIENITSLVRRLAYTKEIFVIVTHEGKKPEEIMKQVFPIGEIGKNVQFFYIESFVLFRIVTNEYYLEKSQYISKVSRNEEETDRNVETLSSHLFTNLYMIPASSTMAVGKRMIDYFTIREEPSLYLNHYMHPYKGKFHPKMVRALINYIHPQSEGVILDNFCGSGTTLVEAGYIGLDSLGVEINPLSALMCNVKTNSVFIEPAELKKTYINLLEKLRDEIQSFQLKKKGQHTLEGFVLNSKNQTGNKRVLTKTEFEARNAAKRLRGDMKENLVLLEKFILTRKIITELKEEPIRDFLLLSLSGTISDLNRRSKKEFLYAFEERLKDLYHRIYLYHKLNELLKIRRTKSFTFISDTRDMKEVKDESVDAILNSPPYSTALDYIRNDEPQLVLLDLVDSFEELERNMMGNPRVNFNKSELWQMLKEEKNNPIAKIQIAMEYVNLLVNNNREDVGLRVFKFFIDMYYSIIEMYRVLKKGAKSAIVIGNNHFKVKDAFVEIPNGKVLEALGVDIGFTVDKVIHRELQKSQAGNIQKEIVLILTKD